MIRQLADLAGEFVGSCDATPVIGDSIKQECFNMHCTFFEFFTDSILYIRRMGEDPKTPGVNQLFFFIDIKSDAHPESSSSLHQPFRSLEEGLGIVRIN